MNSKIKIILAFLGGFILGLNIISLNLPKPQKIIEKCINGKVFTSIIGSNNDVISIRRNENRDCKDPN